MEKKAELTTQQIVLIVLLVVSFAVILFFIVRLNLKEVSDKEVCHNSVALKGRNIIAKVTNAGSLDCKTSYVCIGDDCGDFVSTRKVKVDVKNSTQVMKAIADEMADCWWMFGEGKVAYADLLGDYHCAICDVIKFDKNIPPITSWAFESYLKNNFYDSSQKYFTYLYNSQITSKTNFPEIVNSEKYVIITGQDKVIDVPFVDLRDDKLMHPVFIKQSDISTMNPKCDVFDITKA